MFNWPRQSEVALPVWRPSEPNDDSGRDGPIALLRGLLSLAARYKAIVLACMVAGITISLLYALTLPPTYNATTTLLLEPRRAATSLGETGGQQILDLNRADGELQTIRSERLLSSVFDGLNLRENKELGPQPPSWFQQVLEYPSSVLASFFEFEDPRGSRIPANPSPLLSQDGDIAAFLKFTNRLTARRVGQSFVLEIEYSSSDPALPARVANATASAYIFQVIAFKEQIARAGTEALQGRLDSLSRQVDAAREAMQSGTLPSIPTPDADARVIGAALPPLGPSAPRKSLIVALGGVLGLIGGCTVVALRLALDRRVKDGKELSRELRIPCFGTLPKPPSVGGPQWRVTAAHHHKFLSSVRDIRTSIEVASAGAAGQANTVIAVVSYKPTTGVAAICEGLADLIGKTNKNVTLFASSDFGPLGPEDGQLTRAGMSLADVPFTDCDSNNLGLDTPGSLIVPVQSSSAEANLFTDYAHPRIEKVVAMARNRGDVLIALPALGLSMDGLALAGYADAIIIIADAKETTIDEVAEAAILLRRASPVTIGAVIYR